MTHDREAPLRPVGGIIVYGTDWCPDCLRARRFLERKKLAYTWIDVDQERLADAFVRSVNRGNRSVPTVLFPDGSILVEPTNQALAHKLEISE
ncbi:MAG TPA: glutaredoxin domain-containing protein [Anaerolineales bacterium]|jgi:mycoredoxin|nr:glutaredoxin domain-containing protein [Anaerolineales bacterium]